MRLYELFAEASDIVIEAGVGLIIPGVNTTPDVKGPKELSRQAKKFGFKVGTKGQVPKLKPNGKLK